MTSYDPEYPGDEEPDEGQPPYDFPPEDRTPSPNHPAMRDNGQAVIPLGEIDTGEALNGLVAFTRSVNLGTKDNNAHYRIEMPFVVQPGWDWPTIAAHAADAFWHCKAVVYDQAGLPFTVDEGGVLRETLRHHFPDAEPASRPQRQAPARAASREGGGGQRRRSSGGSSFPHPRDIDQPEHISDELWDDLVDNYSDGWYDNREAKAAGQYKDTASDFVRKSDRTSVWLRPFVRQSGGRGRGYDN